MSVEAAVDHLPGHVPVDTESAAFVSKSTELSSSPHFLDDIALLFPTVSIGCGRTSSENCTYFESTGSEVGNCGITICKVREKIEGFKSSYVNNYIFYRMSINRSFVVVY